MHGMTHSLDIYNAHGNIAKIELMMVWCKNWVIVISARGNTDQVVTQVLCIST